MMLISLLLSVALLIHPHPIKTEISAPDIIRKPFPELELRDTTHNLIVIHYDSSNSISLTLNYLRRTGNAYHYLISRAGVIYKLIDPKYQARHAGLSEWDGLYHVNKFSIGICLENNGVERYTSSQYKSLTWLIDVLKRRYPDIKNDDIVGHSSIAIPHGRKRDPGPLFNWSKLRNLLG